MRRNSEGFTLAELLLAVAIIGVLVSVSIPIFGAQLKKAREAVDIANERSAKAAAISAYMLEGSYGTKQSYYYDARKGTVSTTEKPAGYGKSEERPALSLSETGSAAPKGAYVVVEIDEDGLSRLWWEGGTGGGNSGGGSTGGGGASGGTGGGISTDAGGLKNGDTIVSWEDLILDGLLSVDTPNNGKHAVIGSQSAISGELAIREGITDITGNVFKGRTGLTSVQLPTTLKVIGTSAFEGSGLTELTIPDTVTQMGNYSFSGITSLKTVNWHYSGSFDLDTGKYIFSGSGSGGLTVNFYGTQAQWDSVKEKTGLSEGNYILNLMP